MSARDDDNGKPNVAVVGRFQIGKSTLVNCLLDDRVARTGDGISTTKVSTIYTYGQIPSVEMARTWKDNLVVWEPTDFRLRDFLNPGKGWEAISGIRISLWKPLLQQINLVDTPGIDANADDTARALASLENAHFVIVLLENTGMCDAERRLLADIRERNLPFTVIVNCRQSNGKRWFPDHNDEVVRAVSAGLANLGHLPRVIAGKSGVWPCNLLWFWHASEHIFENPDGEERAGDIEGYINKYLKKKATAAVTFQQSNFEHVRFFFENNHWLMIDDDKKKNTVFIASPGTVEFLQRLGDDEEFFTPFLERTLLACWLFGSPMSRPYRRLLSLSGKIPEESDEKKYRQWIVDLAQTVESYPFPDKFIWSGKSSRNLTDWLDTAIGRLPEPYLVNCSPDMRSGYLQRFQEYAHTLDKEQLTHEAAAALFSLRDEYERMAAAWNELRKHAPGAQNYFKSGFFGQIFTDGQQTPAGFRASIGAAFDAMSELIAKGDSVVQPMIDKIIHKYWNGAFELLADTVHDLASRGQDLSLIAYDTPDAVRDIPWAGGTVFNTCGCMILRDIMENADIPEDQKTRMYCLCRRIGVRPYPKRLAKQTATERGEDSLDLFRT